MGVSDDTATATDLQKDVSGETDISMAHPVEVVELQDGDTYDMAVTKVKKEIGNSEVTMLAYNGSVP